MSRYQIRDETFGLALYDAETPRDALLAYFADRARGEIRPLVETDDDGSATVSVDGTAYRAIPLGSSP